MKKIILLLTMIILFSTTSHAFLDINITTIDDFANYLGIRDKFEKVNTDAETLSNTIVEYQEKASQSVEVPNLEDKLFEARVNTIEGHISLVWNLILGLLLLIKETVVLLVYVIEMQIVILIFFKYIPMLFNKFTTSLAELIYKKVGK